MDFQVLFNVALSVVMMLSGWMIRSVYDAINKLRQDQILLERMIGQHYVKKDDYREDIREIKSMLSNIFNKLDNKEDKK
jgi:uncharacterized membrane protein